jgi:hypothetical protein
MMVMSRDLGLATSLSKRLSAHPDIHTRIESAECNHDDDGHNDRRHWKPLALVPRTLGARKPVTTGIVPHFIVYD